MKHVNRDHQRHSTWLIVVTHSSQKTCQLQFISTGTRRESASWMRRLICFVFFQIPSIISLLQGSRCGNINSSIRPSSQSVCRIDLNKFNQLCPTWLSSCISHLPYVWHTFVCLKMQVAQGSRTECLLRYSFNQQILIYHLSPTNWDSGYQGQEVKKPLLLVI